MLVDDEPHVLHYLERLLEEKKGVEVVGKYFNSYQAIEEALKYKPEVAFLDIEMPDIQGIELAGKIQEGSPETQIVFVTAYSQYAVDAFELNAVDYLVKPIQRERLNKTIQRIKQFLPFAISGKNGDSFVYCLKCLQFKRSKAKFPTTEIHWRTSKAKELFMLLLHYRQVPVRKDVLIETLWPGHDSEKGMDLLYSTIYQVRKTLKSNDIDIKVNSHEDSYILNLNGTKVDVDEWEKGVLALPVISDDTLSEYQKYFDMYHGDYLAEVDYIWVEAERERLRSLWLNLAAQITDFLISKGNYTPAITMFHTIQKRYPFMEDSYYKLMHLYEKKGDHYSSNQQYLKLKEMEAGDLE
ncbi:response regulator [Salibacterium lacus]|uniref:Response regulator n=1 Tax=Salibacterium lacus TaxID=1898109 RepID=A0ABW5T4L1_9BACI